MDIEFILVEPAVPENIGASARAIKTMGFEKLVLVNPCEWKEGKSRWVAHGSAEILDNAVVFPTLAGALKKSDFAIATSTRKRNVRMENIPVENLGSFLGRKRNSVRKISVVFGREESGLTNEEIQLCDITSSVNMSTTFPSLNLSHAVMLYAWELSSLEIKPPDNLSISEPDSYKALRARIENLLPAIGIRQADNRYGRILERLAFLGDDDVHLLHSICAHISESLK